MPLGERDIKWSTDFICHIKPSPPDDAEISCDIGGWPPGFIGKGALRGNDIIASDIHRQKIILSETWVSDLDYAPMWLSAEHGNIIGCCLDERTGIIQCAEGKEEDEVIRELELRMR